MVDVFISYSHLDRSWVIKVLEPWLTAHSFSYLIDYRNFVAGALGINEMQRCVEESRHTLIVLSPNYVASEWSTLENVMAQSLDPAAINRRLVPIMQETCTLPLRLTIIHHRDLRNDDADQWNRLIDDLT